jgi:hypothetical protein
LNKPEEFGNKFLSEYQSSLDLYRIHIKELRNKISNKLKMDSDIKTRKIDGK